MHLKNDKMMLKTLYLQGFNGIYLNEATLIKQS